MLSQGREAFAILPVGVKLAPFGHKDVSDKTFQNEIQKCFNEPATRNGNMHVHIRHLYLQYSGQAMAGE